MIRSASSKYAANAGHHAKNEAAGPVAGLPKPDAAFPPGKRYRNLVFLALATSLWSGPSSDLYDPDIWRTSRRQARNGKGVQSTAVRNHDRWASAKGQTRLSLNLRFFPRSSEIKGPKITREKPQRLGQVPNEYRPMPEIRLAGRNDDLQLTSPTGAGSSWHNTIRDRDRSGNEHEIANMRLQWLHTITAKHFRVDDQISANSAANFRPPKRRRIVAEDDAGRRYLK
ncbi:MAG: hypothetical protein ABSG65_11130 [Bryobacteraceae bacterium]